MAVLTPVAVGGKVTAASVNQIVNALGDSGWISIPLSTGWAPSGGLTPQYRRLNGVVYIRGRASYSSGGTTTIGILPATFRPAVAIRRFLNDGVTASTGALLVLDTNGELRAAATTATPNLDGSHIAEL